MADKTRAKDTSSLHRYRIELPLLVDDLDLDVYEFRLYAHLKRVAADEGSCWQSARTLAKVCKMSASQISKAKASLEQRGLITRQERAVRGGIADDISIVDIWPATFKRYAQTSTQESDREAITSTSKRSPDDHLQESDREAIALTSKRSLQRMEESIPYRDHESTTTTTAPDDARASVVVVEQVEKTTTGGDDKTELYHWLRAHGVNAPAAALRNQHHDLAATQAMYAQMVGSATGAQRQKLIGAFVKALDADGPQVRAAPARPVVPDRPAFVSPLAGLPTVEETKASMRRLLSKLRDEQES